jgi:hypothetical protein
MALAVAERATTAVRVATEKYIASDVAEGTWWAGRVGGRRGGRYMNVEVERSRFEADVLVEARRKEKKSRNGSEK